MVLVQFPEVAMIVPVGILEFIRHCKVLRRRFSSLIVSNMYDNDLIKCFRCNDFITLNEVNKILQQLTNRNSFR
jgi:hypothetical protein